MFERIREIIADQTGKDAEEITLETNVKTEDEFDVKIENVEGIETVADVVKLVEENKK